MFSAFGGGFPPKVDNFDRLFKIMAHVSSMDLPQIQEQL